MPTFSLRGPLCAGEAFLLHRETWGPIFTPLRSVRTPHISAPLRGGELYAVGYAKKGARAYLRGSGLCSGSERPFGPFTTIARIVAYLVLSETFPLHVRYICVCNAPTL